MYPARVEAAGVQALDRVVLLVDRLELLVTRMPPFVPSITVRA
jgi:hypothetical protein